MQIGPRIRVGGPIGRAGQKLKEGAGKVAKAAAPVAAFFNPALGAAMGAVGKVMDTSDGGTRVGDLPRMALQAGATYGLGKAGQGVLKSVKGAGSVGAKAKAGLGAVAGLGGTKGGAPGAPAGAAKEPGWMDTLSGAAGKLLGGGGEGGGGSLLDKLLLGGTVATGAMDEMQSRKLAGQAADAATGSYDQRAPLRAKAMAMLAGADQPAPDAAGLFDDPGNVYAQPAAAAPQAAPQLAPTPMAGRMGGQPAQPRQKQTLARLPLQPRAV